MIDVDSWPLKAQLAFVVSPFLIIILGMIVNGSVIWSRDFKVLNEAFRNNTYVAGVRGVMGDTSIRARWFIACTVAGAVVFKKFNCRIGVVSESEVMGVPVHLRKRLRVAYWLNAVGFSWLVLVCAVIKLGRLH